MECGCRLKRIKYSCGHWAEDKESTFKCGRRRGIDNRRLICPGIVPHVTHVPFFCRADPKCRMRRFIGESWQCCQCGSQHQGNAWCHACSPTHACCKNCTQGKLPVAAPAAVPAAAPQNLQPRPPPPGAVVAASWGLQPTSLPPELAAVAAAAAAAAIRDFQPRPPPQVAAAAARPNSPMRSSTSELGTVASGGFRPLRPSARRASPKDVENILETLNIGTASSGFQVGPASSQNATSGGFRARASQNPDPAPRRRAVQIPGSAAGGPSRGAARIQGTAPSGSQGKTATSTSDEMARSGSEEASSGPLSMSISISALSDTQEVTSNTIADLPMAASGPQETTPPNPSSTAQSPSS